MFTTWELRYNFLTGESKLEEIIVDSMEEESELIEKLWEVEELDKLEPEYSDLINMYKYTPFSEMSRPSRYRVFTKISQFAPRSVNLPKGLIYK